MTLHVQRFVDDDLTIHIGWPQIFRWSRVLAAAREHYVHGLVTIGPWTVAEW